MPTIPKMYTVEEVAELTHAPAKSVAYWIYTGKLESLRAGRRRLVTEQALSKFLGLHKDADDADRG